MDPDFFGAQWYYYQTHEGAVGWCRVDKFSNFVPPDTLKMLSLALPVLRFLCKSFSKLLKLILQKTLFHGWFLKNSYIQIKNVNGYKPVRAAKQSELKRCK